jgi:hypothetical protein
MVARVIGLLLAAVASVHANVWTQTNDVLALSETVTNATSGEIRLTVEARQGSDIVDLSGIASSRWSWVDVRDGKEVAAYVGSVVSAAAGRVRFEAPSWGRVGTFSVRGMVYPSASEPFLVSWHQITVTSASPVAVYVTGGEGSSGSTTIVTSGVQAVSATNGLFVDGSNSITLGLDTATRIGGGSTWVLLMDVSGGVTSFYWSTSIVSPTGGVNAVYFTNSVSYGALASTVTVDQTWTVPGGVTQAAVKCWGAGGGGGNNYAGGSGGYAFSVLAVSPGETLVIRVGQGGRYNSTIQALPGGGTSTSAVNTLAGNGGGYSGAFRGTNVLIVAGGGGGGAYANNSGYGSTGGSGGGSSGSSGGYYAPAVSTMAAGGSQTNGGASGTNSSSSIRGRSGDFLMGGTAAYLASSYSGGHGGGGYFGGGGGGYTNAGISAGGAGGSCFAPSPFGMMIRGNNSGDDDWQTPWGAGGSSTAAGSDGRIVIKW